MNDHQTGCPMFTYPGNIHVHSSYSDGSGDFDQIAADAASVGLSFVIITDHETLAGLSEESILNGVVVLVGSEINRLHSHYLALDLDYLIESNENNPQVVIDRVREAGGLGFISHPFEKGHPYIEKGKAYPWKHWPVFCFNGLEIWNYTSHWRGRDPSPFKTLYRFFFNRKAAMDAPPREILQLWDCYNISGHRVFAIGSSDAHATVYKLFGLLKVKVFTYRYIFKTINTYIVLDEELSADFDTARKQILSALREGRCYISFDSLSPGRNFAYYASLGRSNVLMGGETIFHPGLTLHVRAPHKRAVIRMIRNGQLVAQKTSPSFEYKPSGPGVYRVEVYYKPLIGNPRPWIYSNPIYLIHAET